MDDGRGEAPENVNEKKGFQEGQLIAFCCTPDLIFVNGNMG
jgi:hypothetical protein